MRVQSQDLVLRFYDTVADHSKLSNVLQEFAEFISARGCIVFEIPNHRVASVKVV